MNKFVSFIRNIISRNRARRFFAVKLLGDFLVGDYRQTWSEIDWYSDSEFNRYLDKFDERDGFNTHRRFALWQLLRLTTSVPGDTAECGVYRGASSYLILAGTDDGDVKRKHFLFDSFEGLSEPLNEDGTHWEKGALAVPETIVANNLKAFSERLIFSKGWIPERFPDAKVRKFRFVHVDVDLYQPTKDSLIFFYERLSPGGIFLCDDYAFGTCPGATKAVDEFLADRPEKMITLPSGGGFFIKGLETRSTVELIV